MYSKLPKFLQELNPDIYQSDNYVVLDFETTTKDKGDPLNPDNRLLLSCYTVVRYGEVEGHYNWRGEAYQKHLLECIEAADFIVAANAKFELQWLKRCGLDLHNVLVWDTQIAEYVMLGNRKAALDLDSVAARYGVGAKENEVTRLIKGGVEVADIPKYKVLKYCKQDVDLTWKVFQKQRKLLAGHPLCKVMFTRCLLTPALADIEGNGATLDAERVYEEWKKCNVELAEIEKELDEVSGGINLNSPHQLAKFLYEDLKLKEIKTYGKVQRNAPNKQFPDGMPKTDLITIGKLKATTKRQRRVLDLIKKQSGLNAALTKNLNFFKGVCENNGGIFYPIFNQTVTATHRLSSSGRKIEIDGQKKGCQFQNFPRKYKPLFRSRSKDRLIAEGDGAQLEFRIAAHLGRDEVAKQEIIDGKDIHSVTADTLTKAGEPTSRQDAKAFSFKPLYGGSKGSKAVEAYCQYFREHYKGISDQQQAWAEQALATGKVVTEWGMVFHFPYTKLLGNGSISNFTNICNYPVQSAATAEIIPIALVYFWHLSRGLDILVINTIHDSIIADIHKDCVEDFTKLSEYCMIDCVRHYLKEVYNVDLFVPLGCGIKVAEHWGEGEEVKINEQLGHERV